MPPSRLAEWLKPFADHPVTRVAERLGDPALRARAAEEAACVEASLAEVRRIAGRGPPVVLVRAVEWAMREVRRVAARHWSREVEQWRADALKELGALLFVHAGAAVELEVVVVDRTLRLPGATGSRSGRPGHPGRLSPMFDHPEPEVPPETARAVLKPRGRLPAMPRVQRDGAIRSADSLLG